MKPGKSTLYHLFPALSVVNLLVYRLFIGIPVKGDGKRSFPGDQLFNCFLLVSLLLLISWVAYHVCRKKLGSQRLILLHLAIASFVVAVLPWLLINTLEQAPRRYLDYESQSLMEDLFGSLSLHIGLAAIILLGSNLLITANIMRFRSIRRNN